MSLRECTERWGTSSLASSDPVVETVRNAIYVPFSPGTYIAEDHRWGVFREDGCVVHAAIYRRGPGPARVSGAERCDPAITSTTAPGGDYVYIGPMIQHYGHFITTTLARLWYVHRYGAKGAKLLLHSENDPQDLYQLTYLREIFDALGIRWEQLVRFTETTRISSLVVPAPAFVEQHLAHPVFRSMCLQIGERIAAPTPDDVRPTYLSKERLVAGVSKIANEAALTKCLAQAGTRIAYPETIPLSKQIALFNSSPCLIGAGSALHTSIFCERPMDLIALQLNNVINSNFDLIDLLRGRRTQHVTPDGGFFWEHRPEQLPAFIDAVRRLGPPEAAPSPEDPRAFVIVAHLADPSAFASGLLARLSARGFLD